MKGQIEFNRALSLSSILLCLLLFVANQGLFNNLQAATGPDSIERAPNLVGDCYSTYLPSLNLENGGRALAQGGQHAGPTAIALAGPNFTITNPKPGWTVSAVSNFAVQASSYSAVQSVSFKAGDIELGTDTTPEDGFSAFLDTSQFNDGPLTLTATATSHCGTTTQSVDVNVVANLPTNGVIGEGGGSLASEIGSVIIFPENALDENTSVTVSEKTQQEITDANGFEWDEMAVTFLGAQVVTTTSTLNQPPAMVASAGFANRVQPGQAIVNYRIIPDADGDGVDELVVVNTASVGPQGFVVSDPAPQFQFRSLFTTDSSGRRLKREVKSPSIEQVELIGWPGQNVVLEMDTFEGFTIASPLDVIIFSEVDNSQITYENVAMRWRSDARMVEYGFMIPFMPLGPATGLLIYHNETGREVWVELRIEIVPKGTIIEPTPPPIVESGEQTRDLVDVSRDVLAGIIADLVTLEAENVEPDIPILIVEVEEYQTLLNDLDLDLEQRQGSSNAIDEEILEILDQIARGSNAADLIRPGGSNLGGLSDLYDDASLLFKTIADAITNTRDPGFSALFAPSFDLAAIDAAINSARFSGVDVQCIPSNSTASVNAITSASNQIVTGMGSVLPTGGPACGMVAASEQAGRQHVPTESKTVVKVFSGGAARPFSAVADSNGYFFLPMIPEGEPFVALAIDTESGVTRTYTGTGPALDRSKFLKFDFTREQPAVGTPLQLNQRTTGSISPGDAPQIYSFTVEGGGKAYIDSHLANNNFTNARWSIIGPTGQELAVTNILRFDLGRIELAEPGQYLLTITADPTEPVDYAFTVWDISQSGRFDIAYGERVSDGAPGAGAGKIERPGAEDVYNFSGTAGETIFIDVEKPDILHFPVGYRLLSPTGDELLMTFLFQDITPVSLPETGEYQLIVGENEDSTGTYEFTIYKVPDPDMFSIGYTQTISNGVPSAGAGNIEIPTARDIYNFSGVAGETIFIDVDKPDLIHFPVGYKLLDPNGSELLAAVVLQDLTPVTLSETGQYQLIVGADIDDVGTYSFTIYEVPDPEIFDISYGQVVSDGVPGAGAGNIEISASRDVYNFAGTAGQTIVIDTEKNGLVDFRVGYRLLAPSGDELLMTFAFTDSSPITLQESGQYQLVVGEDTEDTGPYSFVINLEP